MRTIDLLNDIIITIALGGEFTFALSVIATLITTFLISKIY